MVGLGGEGRWRKEREEEDESQGGTPRLVSKGTRVVGWEGIRAVRQRMRSHTAMPECTVAKRVCWPEYVLQAAVAAAASKCSAGARW